MAEIQGVFKRYEKKYLLNPQQVKLVTEKILEHMKLDRYGLSTICSLYFDTEQYNSLLQRMIDGTYPLVLLADGELDLMQLVHENVTLLLETASVDEKQ